MLFANKFLSGKRADASSRGAKRTQSGLPIWCRCQQMKIVPSASMSWEESDDREVGRVFRICKN